MPNIDHENIGEVAKSKYLKGTIVSTDSEDDTAIVSVPGFGDVSAIIFYHCKADAVKRDNGALKDGAGAFAEDDEVIVLRQADGKFKVLGHADGEKRECGKFWRFRLFHGGRLLDMDSESDTRFMFEVLFPANVAIGFGLVTGRNMRRVQFQLDDPDFTDDPINVSANMFFSSSFVRPQPPGLGSSLEGPIGPIVPATYARFENLQEVVNVGPDGVEDIGMKYDPVTQVMTVPHGNLTNVSPGYKVFIRLIFLTVHPDFPTSFGNAIDIGYVKNGSFLQPGNTIHDHQITGNAFP